TAGDRFDAARSAEVQHHSGIAWELHLPDVAEVLGERVLQVSSPAPGSENSHVSDRLGIAELALHVPTEKLLRPARQRENAIPACLPPGDVEPDAFVVLTTLSQ